MTVDNYEPTLTKEERAAILERRPARKKTPTEAGRGWQQANDDYLFSKGVLKVEDLEDMRPSDREEIIQQMKSITGTKQPKTYAQRDELGRYTNEHNDNNSGDLFAS